MTRQATRRFLALAGVLMMFSASCRHEHEDNSLALNDPDKLWYDSAGTAGGCDAPGTSCPNYQDEKDFVDLCVAKGFQAKSCGCAMRCSGKSGYVKPSAPAVDPKLALTSTPAAGCSAEAKTFIDQTQAGRKPGSDLDHCIGSHVCNGNLSACAGDERQTTARLRAYARQHCDAEVLGAFCKDGNLDTFACSEDDIAHLSHSFTESYGKDRDSKRCYRNVICSGDKDGCAAGPLKEATAIRATIDHEGCQYWLRLFCNIGGKTQ